VEQDSAHRRRKKSKHEPRVTFKELYSEYRQEFTAISKEKMEDEHCIPNQDGRETFNSLRAAACCYSGNNPTTDALYDKSEGLFEVSIMFN
jgi:hypothetical protein